MWGFFSVCLQLAHHLHVGCFQSIRRMPDGICRLFGATRMSRIFFLCPLLFFVFSAQAGQARWVDPARIQAEQLLPPPPAPGSAASQDELALLHQIQASRSKSQIALAQSDATSKSIFLYQDVLGEKFDPDNFPITAEFSRRIKQDVHRITGKVKTHFHRIRPYNLDQTLAPVCATKTSDHSYPSEHSTLAYVYALVLIEMVPERRAAILARADDYVHNRLVCGAHFPSDVAAGRQLAYAIHARMDGNPHFHQALANARRELRAAHGVPHERPALP
jgi:acid phosphatase (class A)